MKYPTILLYAALGFATLSSISCVAVPVDTSGGYAYSADDGPNDQDFRGKVHRLRDHYDRVYAEAQRCGAGVEVRDHLADIDRSIHRVARFVFSGEFNPDRAQENISNLHRELRHVSEHLRA